MDEGMLDHHLRQLLINLRESDDTDRGPVAAAIIDGNKQVYANAINPDEGKITHAERHAADKFVNKYGQPSESAVIITTLSPCHLDDPLRKGRSCTELIKGSEPLEEPISHTHTGYIDPWQLEKHEYENDHGVSISVTQDPLLNNYCKDLFQYFELVEAGEEIDAVDFIEQSLKSL